MSKIAENKTYPLGVVDPVSAAGKAVEKRRVEKAELHFLLAVHDAIADMSEATGCYLVDRYGSMHKAREKAKRG